MSKLTNGGLTLSGTGCFSTAIWHRWASKANVAWPRGQNFRSIRLRPRAMLASFSRVILVCWSKSVHIRCF